jgi:hypothetical protein
MKKSVLHIILPEIKTTVVYFSGQIVLDDLIQHCFTLSNDKAFNPVDFLIADFRDAHLELPKKDILSYIEFIRLTKKLLGDRRAAILTQTPNQVVASEIYIMNLGDLPMKVDFFSTLEAALRWVNNPLMDALLVEEALKKMKNS